MVKAIELVLRERARPMPSRVICISRTLAAGGEEVGRGVAERLGFRVIDAEIIQRAAEKADVQPKRVGRTEQRQPLIRRLISSIAFPGQPGACRWNTTLSSRGGPGRRPALEERLRL